MFIFYLKLIACITFENFKIHKSQIWKYICYGYEYMKKLMQIKISLLYDLSKNNIPNIMSYQMCLKLI